MRYGITIDVSAPIPAVIDEVRQLRDAGFDSAASSQIFGYDALTLLALVGAEVPDIELVTAVVPTYPRHPIMLAAQALTVQAATGGRLALGIGLSHQIVIEGMFGYSYERPARHMREYLLALMPLLRGEPGTFDGETVKATTLGPLEIDAPAPPVLVAALGPVMLRLAGSLADGTATWMTGPATLESHIIPSMNSAAADAGRDAPRIAAAFPVSVTADPDAARELAARVFSIYGQLPSYRAMLDREGAEGPADVAFVGDESVVADQIHHLADIGVTDFTASPYGSDEERARTMTLLSELANTDLRG
jgi:F420-dependent oxidoreductase-like protein